MRVRLCKGAYKEPESVAFQSRLDVDKSYVRCLSALMAGGGYPMIATHDPRLIAIGEDRARWFDRSADEFEFQMLFGVRPDEQSRLAALGYTVRVYLPYGTAVVRLHDAADGRAAGEQRVLRPGPAVAALIQMDRSRRRPRT